MQQDIHDETATIREALEFSALLRQDRDIPKPQKLAYVDEIIKLLELGPYQDAVVKSLNVDLKKRLTLGVELCAKPSLLLFLDEPTSVSPFRPLTTGSRLSKCLEYSPFPPSSIGSGSSGTLHNPSAFQPPNRTIRPSIRHCAGWSLLLFWASGTQLR